MERDADALENKLVLYLKWKINYAARIIGFTGF
jgi:hypothetical protein